MLLKRQTFKIIKREIEEIYQWEMGKQTRGCKKKPASCVNVISVKMSNVYGVYLHGVFSERRG